MITVKMLRSCTTGLNHEETVSSGKSYDPDRKLVRRPHALKGEKVSLPDKLARYWVFLGTAVFADASTKPNPKNYIPEEGVRRGKGLKWK